MAFFAGAILCVIRSVFLSLSTDIWYDELFSMEFAMRPVRELISLTARDVHPPFYYIILRFFLLVSEMIVPGSLQGNGIPPEITAKVVSILPFVILFIYSATIIRKHFGILPAGVFSFFIVTMPQLPEYTTEIRMYSYAILFVTGMMLHGYLLLTKTEDPARKWDILNGFALWFYATAAAYTHYYGAFSIGIIYGIYLIWMLMGYIRHMKDTESGKPMNFKPLATVVIAINLTVVAYIPWISVVLSQVKAVKANYWIQPVGLRSLGSCVKYLFNGYFVNTRIGYGLAAVLFALAATLVIRTFIRYRKKGKREDLFSLASFMVLPLVVLAGLTASALIRPVFVNRYMLPAYGVFWLSLALMLAKELKGVKKSVGFAAAAAFLVIALIVGVVDFRTFVGNEKFRKIQMQSTLSLFEGFDSDTIIISNFQHVQGLLSYYLNKKEGDYKVYLYQEDPEVLINETVPGLETVYDPVDIYNYLSAGKKVLFLGSFNSREDILRDWQEAYGISSVNHGSYLMERYWFDVFELSR